MAAALMAVMGLGSCSFVPGSNSRPLSAPSLPGDVVITGRVLGPDGSPAANRLVLAQRENTGSDLFGDVLTIMGTAGLSVLTCVTSNDALLNACRGQNFTTSTAGDGTFGLRLRSEDVRSVTGSLDKLDVFTGLPSSNGVGDGPSFEVRVDPSEQDISLGDIAIWGGSVTEAGDSRTVKVSWAPAPDPGSIYHLRLENTSNGMAVEGTAGSGTGSSGAAASGAEISQSLDARLLEDSRVDAELVASGNVAAGPATWTAQTVSFSGVAGAPVSRNRPCTIDAAGGPPSSSGGGTGACWLTDGVYNAGYSGARSQRCQSSSGPFGLCAPEPVRQVTVDLGADYPLSLVVLRAVYPVTDVEVSASSDGRSFTSLGRVDLVRAASADPLSVLVPPGGAQARYVRLDTPSAGNVVPVGLAVQGSSGADSGGFGFGEGGPVAGNGFGAGAPGFPAQVQAVYQGDLASLSQVSVWPGHPPVTPSASAFGGRVFLGLSGPGWGRIASIAGIVAAALAISGGVWLATRRRRVTMRGWCVLKTGPGQRVQVPSG